MIVGPCEDMAMVFVLMQLLFTCCVHVQVLQTDVRVCVNIIIIHLQRNDNSKQKSLIDLFRPVGWLSLKIE